MCTLYTLTGDSVHCRTYSEHRHQSKSKSKCRLSLGEADSSCPSVNRWMAAGMVGGGNRSQKAAENNVSSVGRSLQGGAALWIMQRCGELCRLV